MHLTPIGNGKVLLEPGLGLDPTKPDLYLDKLLARVMRLGGNRLLYDLEKLPVIDQVYYDWLVYLHSTCLISGVEMVAVNISPAAAFGLATSLDTKPPFTCARDVNAVD